MAWIGGLLGLAALARSGRNRRVVLLSLLAVGGLFIVLFGVASGRNSAHYVMFAYAAVDILAGAGVVWAAIRIADKIRLDLRELIAALRVRDLVGCEGPGRAGLPEEQVGRGCVEQEDQKEGEGLRGARRAPLFSLPPSQVVAIFTLVGLFCES